jgi:hypothetical protein
MITRNRTRAAVLGAAAAGLLAVPAYGQLVAHESFDYGAGLIDGQAGGAGWRSPWVSRSDGSPQFSIAQVTEGPLLYPGIANVGNKVRLGAQDPSLNSVQTFRLIDSSAVPGHLLNAQGNVGMPGESVWFAVLGQRNPEATGFHGVATFLVSGHDPDNFNPTQGQPGSPTLLEQTFAGMASSLTDFRWRLAGSQAVPTNQLAAVGPDEVDLLVVRVDFRHDLNDPSSQPDRALLWVNPVLTGAAPDDASANAVNLARAATPHLHFNAIRIAGGPFSASFPNHHVGGNYDEFKLGTGFELVTSTPSEWAAAGGGAYSVSGNWSAGVPQGAGIVAKFGQALSASGTVNVDGPRTVGGLAFDNAAASYTVAGSVITLDRPRGDVGLAAYAGSHTISAPVHLARDAQVTVSAGAELTASSLSAATGTAIRKFGGGTFRANDLSAGSLSIQAGTVQKLPGSGASALGALSVSAGATLDLTDGEIRVQNGNLPAINALVVSGRDGGSWTGSGITSSSAAAQSDRALGIGQDGSDVLVKFTYGGDATLDGSVTIADLGILAANWQAGDRYWFHGDFNYDGSVNIADLGILAANWQKGTAGGGMGFAEALAMFDVFDGVVVPEPSVMGLVGMGLLALRRRRMG